MYHLYTLLLYTPLYKNMTFVPARKGDKRNVREDVLICVHVPVDLVGNTQSGYNIPFLILQK